VCTRGSNRAHLGGPSTSPLDRMSRLPQRFLSRKFWIAFIVNVLGALAYLFVAQQFWADPALRDVPGAGAGDPIIWVLEALPILATFILGNFIWALYEFGRFLLKRRVNLGFMYLSIPVVWAVAIYIDYSHHWAM